MNKEETKPKEVKPKEEKEVLTPKEIKEDTRGGLKEEIKDREGPLVEKELPPNEIVIKKVEPKEEKPLKEKKELEPGMMLYPAKEIHDRLIRMERMLEWLIVQRVTDDQKLIKQPNIADIFKEIASKMDDKKTEGGG